jgi:hypothetical protein
VAGLICGHFNGFPAILHFRHHGQDVQFANT